MPSDYENICPDLQELVKRALSILAHNYNERTHFILELLQNAEDAEATRVRFEIHPDRLEVWHDGRSFDKEDVLGVCGIASTKENDPAKIGKFGIGFKSVYVYTVRPEIHSGDEHFAIENCIYPHLVDSVSIPLPWTTLFILPFNGNDVTPEVAHKEIATGLAKLNSGTMLFLRHIVEIESSAAGVRGMRHTRHESPQGPARRVSITSHVSGLGIPSGTWLIFDAPVLTDNPSNALRVEVAFKLASEKGPDKISVVGAATLSVFFPTAKETKLGFTIQGPYRSTKDRADVLKDHPWNEDLVKKTAALVVSALGHLRDMKLLTVDALLTLPLRTSDFPGDGMFRPIFNSVADALKTQPLIPTDSGDFVSAAHAKIGRSGEIRKLFPAGAPTATKGVVERMQWVSAEITEVRTPDLYKYLREVLHIEEVTPETIVRLLDQDFLQEKPDDWLTRFYEFLAGQEALWRKPRWTGDTSGPARTAPIIRVENGTHVLPFRKDGCPAAYLKSPVENERIPLVRKTIVAHAPSRQFLEKLGFGEFDGVAALRQFVLPLYRPIPPQVSREQNLQHLRWVDAELREMKGDEKIRTFLSEVKDTPLIHASRAASNHEPCYVKPEQTYFRTDELTLYFDGNPDAWFLTEYPEELRETLKKLGISDKERDLVPVRRREGGYVPLEYCMRDNVHFKRRGVQGFDPDLDVDGLRHALAYPRMERSRYIWNRIALPRAQQLRGTVEEATRADFLNKTSRSQVSKMGDALTNAAWLPAATGFVKPAALRLEDLPDGFIRDETLGKQLGMKVDEVAALLQKAGVHPEAWDLAKQLTDDPDLYAQASRLVARAKKPEFPYRPVSDPDRRAKHVRRDAGAAPSKEYEQRSRSVRISEPTQDPATWLRELYKNPTGQMICQICEQEMPFRKRNGEYYFEAVEALDTLSREQHQNHLALCPLCAAKYKEFVKRDAAALELVRAALAAAHDPLVPLDLGGETATLRFVESHFADIQTVVRVPED